jgi:hypothetical protein
LPTVEKPASTLSVIAGEAEISLGAFLTIGKVSRLYPMAHAPETFGGLARQGTDVWCACRACGHEVALPILMPACASHVRYPTCTSG